MTLEQGPFALVALAGPYPDLMVPEENAARPRCCLHRMPDARAVVLRGTDASHDDLEPLHIAPIAAHAADPCRSVSGFLPRVMNSLIHAPYELMPAGP